MKILRILEKSSGNMKKKALFKNFYRTVFRTLPKFFSILFLIALGVMVFVGLKITSPIMRRSVEKRVKDGNLYDFKISSTYGLLRDDEEIISNLSNLKEVEFGYSINLKDETKGSDFHIESMPEKISLVKVTEGSSINSQDEILLDERLKSIYSVGDIISFSDVNKPTIFDEEVKKLKFNKFKVVGFVESPEVITTTVRNTTDNAYLGIVSKDAFDFTYFSYAKIIFSDINDLKMETGKFDRLKSERKTHLQELFENRPIEVHSLIYSQKKKILDENKTKLQKNKSNLENSENELEQNQKRLENGTNDVRTAFANLDYNKKNFVNTINKKIESLNSSKNKLYSKREELTKNLSELVTKNKGLVLKKEEINSEKVQLNKAISDVNAKLETLEKNRVLIAEKEYNQKKEALNSELKELNLKVSETETYLDEVEKGILQTSEGIKKIEDGKTKIASELEKIENGYAEVDKAYNEGIAKFDAYYEKLVETKEKIESGSLDLERGKEKIEDAKEKIEDANKKISEGDEILSKLLDPIYEIEDSFSQVGVSNVYFAADGIYGVSNVFSIFFYFIALLVCLTTMTRTVDEDRVQIGTLKALGYSDVDIAKQYFYYGLSASILGGVIGAMLGFKVISPLVYNSYLKAFIFEKVFDSYYPMIVILGILIAVVCTAVVSYIACINSLKEKISSLMRPKAPKSGGKVLLERLPFLWKELSFLQKVTLRNVFRYKLRLSMTIIGVLGCMALLVLGFGIKDSLNGLSELQYEKYTKYHLSVSYNPMDLTEKQNKFDEMIRNNNDIKDSIDLSIKSAQINSNVKFSEKVAVLTTNDFEKFSEFFGLYTGTEKINSLDDGIYINRKISEKFKVSIGDELNFITNNKNYTSKITGIFENQVGNYIIMNDKIHERIFLKKAINNSKLLILKDSSDVGIKKVVNEIEKDPIVVNVMNIKMLKTVLDDVSYSVNSIILVIIICSGFLSIVVLYSLSNINISERKREIATLKVLGFYPTEIDKYIYKETFILTIIGIFLGVFVGDLLHKNIMEQLAMDSVRFFNKIYILSYVYSACITLFFTFVVYLIVKIVLSKIKMIESLKDVE